MKGSSETPSSLYFYFTPGTGATWSASHTWMPSGGLSQCVNPACVQANAVVDMTAQTVTFNNLVMNDPLGSAVSTVTGTIAW